ncbi:MAG: toll/interleukin-1 receptor domain-containing protein [Pseudomonadota bacterium]
MTEIFVSHALEDAERLKPLVQALSAEGYSVWWEAPSMAIPTGQDRGEAREKALVRARCVILAWSRHAKADETVRDAARAGRRWGSLIPLRLDTSRPPAGLSDGPPENFLKWQGSRADLPWQRLLLQVRALAGPPLSRSLGARLAADTAPLDPDLRIGVMGEEPGAQSAPLTEEARKGAFLPQILLLIALIAGPAFLMGPGTLGAYAIACITALFFFALFQMAEDLMPPRLRALVARWFLPRKAGLRIGLGEAVNGMVDAAFGRHHFSISGLWRSTLTTAISFFAVLPIVVVLSRGDEGLFSILAEPQLPMLLGLTLLCAHLSLIETRFMVRLLGKQGRGVLPILTLDVLLTTTLFVLCFGGLAALLTGSNSFLGGASAKAAALLASLPGPGQTAVPLSDIETAAFFTTCILSIWLWLVVLLAPLSRTLVGGSKAGMSLLGRLIDADGRPIAALGYLTSLFVIFGGLVFIGARHLIA